MSKLKNEILATRVTPEEKDKIVDKAEQYGKRSDVIREVLLAFADGRVTIKPDPTKLTLYKD